MRPTPNIGPNVPAFLRKLWKIVNDPTIDDLVGWSPDGESFVIRNPAEFCYNLLPIYYKHNNMSSFIRQLNMYGFHKLANENGGDKDEIKFFHPCFQQDQSRLLQHIKRKIGTSKPEERKVPTDQIGKVLNDVKHIRGRQESVDTQLATMKQENAALWRELALLRQKHLKQQQIVNKLIHFLVSLVQQPARTTIGVKRRYPLMINDGPETKAIKVNSPDCATIHEIDSEATQAEENPPTYDIPTVTSPLENEEAPIVGLDSILDVEIDDDLGNIEQATTVEDLLNDSEEIDFPTDQPSEDCSRILNEVQKDLDENIAIDNIVSEALEEVNTPQIVLSDDGKTLLKTNMMEETLKNQEPVKKEMDELLGEKQKKDLTVAMRSQDFSKLLSSANDFGIHVNNTQGELENIKDMLFDGGYTLDANAFLDLFNPNESLQLDVPPLNEEDDWPSSSNNDQLFSGSELISYNPNDLLNFDNLLEETEEETG